MMYTRKRKQESMLVTFMHLFTTSYIVMLASLLFIMFIFAIQGKLGQAVSWLLPNNTVAFLLVPLLSGYAALLLASAGLALKKIMLKLK